MGVYGSCTHDVGPGGQITATSSTSKAVGWRRPHDSVAQGWLITHRNITDLHLVLTWAPWHMRRHDKKTLSCARFSLADILVLAGRCVLGSLLRMKRVQEHSSLVNSVRCSSRVN